MNSLKMMVNLDKMSAPNVYIVCRGVKISMTLVEVSLWGIQCFPKIDKVFKKEILKLKKETKKWLNWNFQDNSTYTENDYLLRRLDLEKEF